MFSIIRSFRFKLFILKILFACVYFTYQSTNQRAGFGEANIKTGYSLILSTHYGYYEQTWIQMKKGDFAEYFVVSIIYQINSVLVSSTSNLTVFKFLNIPSSNGI